MPPHHHLCRYPLPPPLISNAMILPPNLPPDFLPSQVPYENGKYQFCLKFTRDQGQHLSRYVLMRDVVWDLHEAKADPHHDNLKASVWGGRRGGHCVWRW